MSGFNQTGGTTGGGGAGGAQGFNQTGGSTGLNKSGGSTSGFGNQTIDEVYGKLRKKAGEIGDSQKHSDATNLLDPIYDMVQKARAKHREVSKEIVNKAWQTAQNAGSLLEDGAGKVYDGVANNWDKAI